MTELKKLVGKRVFVKLDSGTFYNGVVLEVDDSHKVVFITLRDKFNDIVVFPLSQVIKIEEKTNQEGGT